MESYEKKYKELEGKIKNAYLYAQTDSTKAVLEDIFPEIKESEDELTWLTKYIEEEAYSLSIDIRDDEDRIKLKKLQNALAWLEKQESVEEIVERCKDSWYNEGKIQGMREGLSDEEKYQQGWHDALEKQGKRLENYDEYERGRADAIEDTCKWLSQQGDMLKDCFSDINDFVDLYKEAVGRCEKPQGKTALEAIKEEKVDNANKVEAKFKVGDWVVWENQYYKVNYNGCGYELIDQNGLNTSLEYGTVDENARLWDITKDAKNGDVLISKYNKPFIYNGNHNSTHVGAYCGITINDKLIIASEEYHWTEHLNIHPATKEQRDKLLKAMADAGYEWDAEKKELKKVEQNPAWNEEDERNLKRAILYVENPALNVVKDIMLSEWLKSLKERINNKKKGGEE